MRTIRVPADRLKEIRDDLAKTASLEKQASELTHENDVLRRTLDLVASGVLDSAVAVEKLASFLDDSDSLRIMELASTPSAGFGKLGSLEDDDITVSQQSESAEGRLRSSIEDIVFDSGLSVF